MSGKSEKKARRQARKIYTVQSQEWMTEIQMESLPHRIMIALAIISKQRSGPIVTVVNYIGGSLLLLSLAFITGLLIG